MATCAGAGRGSVRRLRWAHPRTLGPPAWRSGRRGNRELLNIGLSRRGRFRLQRDNRARVLRGAGSLDHQRQRRGVDVAVVIAGWAECRWRGEVRLRRGGLQHLRIRVGSLGLGCRGLSRSSARRHLWRRGRGSPRWARMLVRPRRAEPGQPRASCLRTPRGRRGGFATGKLMDGTACDSALRDTTGCDTRSVCGTTGGVASRLDPWFLRRGRGRGGTTGRGTSSACLCTLTEGVTAAGGVSCDSSVCSTACR